MLITIQLEKTKSDRDKEVFHKRFDKEKDSVFEGFLLKLYPEGVTIGENEINHLVNFVVDFMQKDSEAIALYVDWDKLHYSSYVYFKVDNKVYNASYLSHFGLVKDICCNYFKGFDENEINTDYLSRFIVENFEIKSDFTTPTSVIQDVDYIARCIVLGSD